MIYKYLQVYHLLVWISFYTNTFSSLYNVEPLEKIFGTHIVERDVTEAINPLPLLW